MKRRVAIKRLGREFELLVTRINQALLDTDAIVKSPDRIADMVTGQMREVDASIRYQTKTGPKLITIECRDRAKIQDVCWIEQIVTKQRDIGADITIAVTSTNFTQKAITKAKHYGVKVFRINDITRNEILNWAQDIQIELEYLSWGGIQVNLKSSALENNVTEGLEFTYPCDPSNGIYVFEKPTGKPVDWQLLVQTVTQKDPKLVEDVPVGGPALRKTIVLHSPPSLLVTYTNRGQIDITDFEITTDFKKELVPIGFHKTVDYENLSGNSITQFAEGAALLNENQGLIVLLEKLN